MKLTDLVEQIEENFQTRRVRENVGEKIIILKSKDKITIEHKKGVVQYLDMNDSDVTIMTPTTKGKITLKDAISSIKSYLTNTVSKDKHLDLFKKQIKQDSKKHSDNKVEFLERQLNKLGSERIEDVVDVDEDGHPILKDGRAIYKEEMVG